jgi:hypothetical protein
MSTTHQKRNASPASKHSRGNTDFGATQQRPEDFERESQHEDFGVQNDSQIQNQNQTENQNEEETNARVSIKSTDMSENMILFVVEKTILAFEAAAYSLET